MCNPTYYIHIKNNFDLDTKQLHHLESYNIITVTLCSIKLCPDTPAAADTCRVQKFLTTFFALKIILMNILVVNLITVACITCLWSNSVTSLCVWHVPAELFGTPSIAMAS